MDGAKTPCINEHIRVHTRSNQRKYIIPVVVCPFLSLRVSPTIYIYSSSRILHIMVFIFKLQSVCDSTTHSRPVWRGEPHKFEEKRRFLQSAYILSTGDEEVKSKGETIGASTCWFKTLYMCFRDLWLHWLCREKKSPYTDGTGIFWFKIVVYYELHFSKSNNTINWVLYKQRHKPTYIYNKDRSLDKPSSYHYQLISNRLKVHT